MRIHESIAINRPPHEVWLFLTDFFNSPRARPGTLAIRRTSPGSLGRGSVIQGRQMILGFETRLTLTVTEFDPPRRAVVTLAARPGRGAIRTTLDLSGMSAERAEAWITRWEVAASADGPVCGAAYWQAPWEWIEARRR